MKFKTLGNRLINRLILVFSAVFVFSLFYHHQNNNNNYETEESSNNNEAFEINNYGSNVNVLVNKTRYRDVPKSKLKNILFWNDAYGVRTYDVGFGQEHFYTNLCPDTRCYTTSNRTYLKSVADFDAVVIHQRGIGKGCNHLISWCTFTNFFTMFSDATDMPKQRSAKQYYVHWVVESAQYLYMDIHSLNNYFNWTMTYKRNSDFYLPYGRVTKIKDHPPPGPELDALIRDFGQKNQHFAHNRTKDAKAAWFVSHCATQARREIFAKEMKKSMTVDVFGKCTKNFHKKHERKSCSRANEKDCYKMLESTYRFYLSFENSICQDYVTEKFFNILKYDVIPIVFNGGDLNSYAPPHSTIDALEYGSPYKLVKYLGIYLYTYIFCSY